MSHKVYLGIHKHNMSDIVQYTKALETGFNSVQKLPAQDLASMIKENSIFLQNRDGFYELYGTFDHKNLRNTEYIRPFVDVECEQGKHPRYEAYKTSPSLFVNPIKTFMCSQFKCRMSELAISTAHRDKKLSWHIVVTAGKVNYYQLRAWALKNKEEMATLGIDLSMYPKNKKLRMVGTSKHGVGQLHPETFQDDYAEHFLTNTEGLQEITLTDLPTVDWATVDAGKKQLIKTPKLPSTAEVPAEHQLWLDKFKRSEYWNPALQIAELKDKSICFKATTPYDCVLCQRQHINNTNRPVLFKNDTTLVFNCRLGHSGIINSTPHLPQGECVLGDESDDESFEEEKFKREEPITRFDVVKCLKYKTKTNKIKYINQYFIWVRKTRTPLIIELDNTLEQGYIIRKVIETTSHLGNCQKAFSVWMKSPYRRSVDTVTWIPWTVAPATIEEGKQFNLFRGFKHQYDPSFQVDTTITDVFVNHLQEIWANGDPKASEYVLNWFAYKLQKPAEKLITAIVLKAEQGAGKNAPLDILSEWVLGSSVTRQTSDIETLLQKHNANSEKTILVTCDEIGSKGAAYHNNDRMKDLITRRTQQIEPKGIDAYSAPDYNSYIFTTNNNWIVKIESTDRRYCCLEASTKHLNDPAYFDPFWKTLANNNAGKHLFHFFCNRDISQFQPSRIPMTEWKRELKEHAFPPLIRSLVNFGNANCDSKCERWLVKEFYDFYKACRGKENLAVNNYGKQLQKMFGLETTRFRKPGYSQASGFVNLSIDTLLLSVRKLISDPEFRFQKEEEEEDLVDLESNALSSD